MPPAAARGQAVLPPVRAERAAHRARRVERQRRDIHAPAGSAGGAPRMGARAGGRARLARGRRWRPAAGSGGRLRGGSGRSLHQAVEILAVDRLALEQRHRDAVEQLAVLAEDLAWPGRRPRPAAASPRRPPSARCARRSPAAARISRPRKISCSLSPTASGPITLAHAELGDHAAGERRGPLDVVARPGRDLLGAEDDLLGHAAAEEHRQAADRASPWCSCAGPPRAARR